MADLASCWSDDALRTSWAWPGTDVQVFEMARVLAPPAKPLQMIFGSLVGCLAARTMFRTAS